MPPTISLSPLPPVQGQTATICYSGGTLPITLQIVWTPPGVGPSTVTIDADGCTDITIPDSATSISIRDEEGGAEEENSMIEDA